MSEDIQGLKIVFGADVSNFERHLTTANKAINTTQKHLRTLEKALKLDPTSIGLLNEKSQALAAQAQNVKAKLNALAAQMANTSAAAKQLAANESNIAIKASQSLNAYNRINASLATIKDGMQAIAKSHDMAFDREAPLEFVAALEKAGAATEEERAAIAKLVSEYNRLHEVWRKVSNDNNTAQSALQYKTAQIEVQKYNAELKDLYAQLSKVELLRPANNQEKEFKQMAQAVDLCDAEIAALEQRGRTLDGVLSVEGITAKFKNTADTAQALRGKVSVLQKQLKALGETAVSDSAGKSMLELKQSASTAASDFERLNNELAEVRAKMSTVSTSIDDLTYATEKSDKEIEELEKEFEQLTQQEKQLASQTKRAAEYLQRMNNAVNAGEVAGDLEQVESHLKQLQTVAKNSSYAMSAAVRDFATTATAEITPLLSMAGSAVLSKANEMDTAFRSMTKTVNGTEEDFAKLKNEAIEFSQTHAVSATQILEIEAMGGQLGIAVDNLSEFGEVASNLDIATDMDADTISEQLGQLNNILDWSAGDMERYGDALVRLGNNMPAQESKISSVAEQISSMGSIVGMSTPEILAWSAAIASTGQGAESAGTAIQNTMSDIESAVSGGGESLEAFASAAEMSADDFSAAWNNGQASNVMQNFIEGLNNIEKNGGSATQTLSDLGITGVRQVRAIEGLMQTVGNLDDALAMSQNAWDGVSDEWGNAGDAANEAAKKQEGLSGSLQIAQNNLENLCSVIGEQLVPFVDAGASALESLTGVFQEADGTIIQGGVAFAGFLAAAAPITRVLSQAYGSYINFNRVIEKNREALINAAVASGQLTPAQAANALATGKYSKEVTAATKVVEKQSKVQARSAVIMNAGKAALLGLAIAVSAYLIQKFVEWRQEEARVEAANKSLKDSYGSLSTSAEDTAASISSSSGNVVQTAENAADSIVQANLNAIDAYKQTMSSLIENNAELDTYQQVLHDLGDSLSSLEAGDVNNLSVALDGLNGQLGTNFELVATDNGYEIMRDDVAVTIDEIDRLIQKQREQLQVQAYQESLADVAAEKTQALENLRTATDAVTVAQQKADQAWEDYVNADSWSKSAMLQIWTQQQQALERTKTEADEAQASYDALTNKEYELNQALAITTYAMNESATATEKALGSNQTWATYLSSYGVSGLQSFAQFCDESGVAIESLSNVTGLEAQSMITEWQNWKLGIQDAQAGTSESLGEIADSTNDAAASMAENAGASADSMAQSFDSIGNASAISADDVKASMEGAATSVSDAMGDAADSASEGGEAINENTVGPVKKLPADLKAVGQNAAAGLYQGLGYNTSALYARAESIADGIKTRMEKALEIESPSHVMRRIGQFTTEGLALGLEDKRDYVEKMADKLAASVTAPIYDGAYALELGRVFTASGASYTTNKTINSGDSMHITNLTLEVKDVDNAETLYKQLRRVALQNRR